MAAVFAAVVALAVVVVFAVGVAAVALAVVALVVVVVLVVVLVDVEVAGAVDVAFGFVVVAALGAVGAGVNVMNVFNDTRATAKARNLDAALDETTTEYNMAALAFAFYGDNSDRSKHAWRAPYCLWDVAHRAVNESKADRYPSLRAFLDAWRAAVGQCGLV